MEFDKRAGLEVRDFNTVPPGMETFIIPAGKYAVFSHIGTASDAPKTFGYIFGTWLPQSDYKVDLRPHFEILGEKYRRDDPDSEEEVWIPVKQDRSGKSIII
jgi:AraC family transcriptional regulator